MIINAITSSQNQYKPILKSNKHKNSEMIHIRNNLDKKVADLDDLGTIFMLASLPFVLPNIEEYSSKMSKTEKIGGVLVILSVICMISASIKN